MTESSEQFSAGAQGLGYIYQPRFALLQILRLDERTAVLIEKNDDLEFLDINGTKSLASLKHKAEGDRLTDLSVDFWKSVRVWLSSYKQQKLESDLCFFLFTTGVVASDFLNCFLPEPNRVKPERELSEWADDILATSESEVIKKTKEAWKSLSSDEKNDFLSRIIIVDESPRIDSIPSIVQEQHMRTVRREFRHLAYERVEGWWQNEVISLLTGSRTAPISGTEVSDKLCNIAEEYQSNNLPITFKGAEPADVDAQADNRTFVKQLRVINISTDRIRFAIVDYYRAFEQRSAWAREHLLYTGELEEYEERLVEEWTRFKDILFDELDDASGEQLLVAKGKELYKWAEMNCSHIKIRERVEEPYVQRGTFQMLANELPPRVHWHPRFLDRIEDILGAAL